MHKYTTIFAVLRFTSCNALYPAEIIIVLGLDTNRSILLYFLNPVYFITKCEVRKNDHPLVN